MRIRPYIHEKDFIYVQEWVSDERVHALWSAGRVTYPLQADAFEDFIKRDALEYESSAYMVLGEDGKQVGFFMYSLNCTENAGFLKMVVLNPDSRGKGYGKQLIRLALQYAFDITGVEAVRIYVFDVNEGARHCYDKVGFTLEAVVEDGLTYKEEHWASHHLIIRKPDRT